MIKFQKEFDCNNERHLLAYKSLCEDLVWPQWVFDEYPEDGQIDAYTIADISFKIASHFIHTINFDDS